MCLFVCVSDPDVVDDGSSFALCSLWVSYQVIPGTENPPAEGEVLIRGTGQAQTRVLSHSEGILLFKQYNTLSQQQLFVSHLIGQLTSPTLGFSTLRNLRVFWFLWQDIFPFHYWFSWIGCCEMIHGNNILTSNDLPHSKNNDVLELQHASFVEQFIFWLIMVI